MRILDFNKQVGKLQQHYNLKDCNVVVDGQNYFYNLYQSSGLPYQFGCEADKFANYLRNHLRIFKNANVKMYILFKGGHEDINKKYKKWEKYPCYNPIKQKKTITLPIFMKTVYKEVLTEMGVDFVVCEFESKRQCIALAQKLKCPIISNDIEFCFSGVPYIQNYTLRLRTGVDHIECRIFYYQQLVLEYNLCREKIAIFIVLSDEQITTFSKDIFNRLFNDIGLIDRDRNEGLLKWLSKIRPEEALNIIYRYLSSENQNQFIKEMDIIKTFINKDETLGLPALYLLDKKSVVIKENDPEWFEKGVALGNVAITYINLYHQNIHFGSWCIEDEESDDALLFSFDIIAYAYNLMTNYQRDQIIFDGKNEEKQNKDVSVANAATVKKPPYKARASPFENGWEQLKSLHLFEHFLTESLHGINFTLLRTLPEDVILLALALVYFSRRKIDNTDREVYSILLSYVMLGVVFDKVDEKNKTYDLKKKPIIEPIRDKNQVTISDSNVAVSLLSSYFTLTAKELDRIFDRKLIHSLVEFQHCLEQLNNLNKLCGCPYKATVFNKTYNGTFVYKFFFAMKTLSGGQVRSHVENVLSPAPTVLAYLNGLFEVYTSLCMD